MPPALPKEESDSDSLGKEAHPVDIKTDQTMKDENDREDDDDASENDDEDSELFVVEAIHDHRSDFEDGLMRYHVKWKGYEKKNERTWETEENLDGAREILEEYWEQTGGKPVPGEPKSAKKRGRQSTGSQKQPSDNTTKRQRTSKGGRKSNGTLEQDVDLGNLVGFTDVGDDGWKPPVAKSGSWDPLVQSIDTVVRETSEDDLWAYLVWNEKNAEGRFYRSKAKLPVVYKACPQRMLHFYEKHLVFSTGSPDEADANAAK